jgi:hypothetical protein
LWQRAFCGLLFLRARSVREVKLNKQKETEWRFWVRMEILGEDGDFGVRMDTLESEGRIRGQKGGFEVRRDWVRMEDLGTEGRIWGPQNLRSEIK